MTDEDATATRAQTVPECTPCCSGKNIDVFTAPTMASDSFRLDLGETVRKLEVLHARARRAGEFGAANRVLVYCMSGLSRAPSVAVAYLMYSERRRLEDALKALQRRYPRGHRGLMIKQKDLDELKAFEAQLYPEFAERGAPSVA